MAENVKFYFGSQAKYDALVEKNSLALYFIEDTQRLYKGGILMATGANASAMAAGLMSSEDKIKLDSIVETALSGFSPVDGSIVISDGKDGGKLIGVAVSKQNGNILSVIEDGLFVSGANQEGYPEFAIEKQSVAEDGYATSYKLKRTLNGEISYVGDTINVAKDMVLQSATLEIVAINGVPYEGAVIGEPYIDMAFNDAAASHVYVPVKGLVDTYTAGDGIEIIDNKIYVKIAPEANGLVAVDGALKLNLATTSSAGALSPVDKAFLDLIPSTYATIERVKETSLRAKYEVSSKPEGTIVNYGEDEIRVMCPENTVWVKQDVGATGNANMYYMGFKAYAPDGAVSFKEGDRGVIIDEMFTFDSEFAGTDEFGRNYSICWLALASYDATSDTWTYFGKNSTTSKYIGWDYVVEWYDKNGVVIASDSIRINLSNESCHLNNMPYYMADYATLEQLSAVEDAMAENFTWGEL